MKENIKKNNERPDKQKQNKAETTILYNKDY